MSHELSPRVEHYFQLGIDLAERLFLVLLFATFVAGLSHTIVLRPYNMLAVISEGIAVYFILIRRPATAVTLKPLDWASALLGTALPMFVRAGGAPLVSPVIGTLFMSLGLLLAIWAKMNLRQSFGVVAANRGPVDSGPYRFVRHPMYAGYVIGYIGFFLNNPILWNFAVYAAGILFQILRILAEEKVLAPDPLYGKYQYRVPHRLLPGVF